MVVLALAGCLFDSSGYQQRLVDLSDHDGDGVVYESDCDDDNSVVYPGAAEYCDDVDNDCDGALDEGAVDAAIWFPDSDMDGYGVPDGATSACDSPGGAWADNSGDCLDTDSSAHPGGTEVPYDGIDQDCSGADLDDVDGDGVSAGDDCDDGDRTVHPGATEVPYDGIDQDCSGADLDDLDSDGVAGGSGDDCDDGDPTVHPGAPETWEDAFTDQDCDGALEQDRVGVFGEDAWYSSASDAGLGATLELFGDVDGDGWAEVLTAATGVSRAYSHSGGVFLLSPVVSGDVDGDPTRTVDAGGADWNMGAALDAADLDGDGWPEVAVTATGQDTRGGAWLVDGASLATRSLQLPEDGIAEWAGSGANTYWGSDVAFLGDVDGDGVTDVAMSAAYATVDGMAGAGAVAVFSASTSSATVDDVDLRWDGYYVDGGFGASVAPVGDVDGDGLSDTMIAARNGDIFVVVPGTSGPVDVVALARVTRDADARSFRSVPVPDLDGDAVMDVAILGDGFVGFFADLDATRLASQADWWACIEGESGTAFADVAGIGDRTGDGLVELVATATGHSEFGTSWAGIVLGDQLGWGVTLRVEDVDIATVAERGGTQAGASMLVADSEDASILVLGAPADDRGAVGGGAVDLLPLDQ